MDAIGELKSKQRSLRKKPWEMGEEEFHNANHTDFLHNHVASHQRGESEEKMLDVQHANGGGVMSYAVEHTGDLIHRMSERSAQTGGGHAYVKSKVNGVLRVLTNPYGFMREHKENMNNNAKYREKDFDQHKAKIDQSLQEYADAHRKIPVFNEAHSLARSAAVALGEKNIQQAVAHLKRLKSYLDEGRDAWHKRSRKLDRQMVMDYGSKVNKIEKAKAFITFPGMGVPKRDYTIGYRDPKYTEGAVNRLAGKKIAQEPTRGLAAGRMKEKGKIPHKERTFAGGLNTKLTGPIASDLGTQRHEEQHGIFQRIGEEHGANTRWAVGKHLIDSIPREHRARFHALANEAPSVRGAHKSLKNEEKVSFMHSYLNSPTYRKQVHKAWENKGMDPLIIDRTIKGVHNHIRREAANLKPEHFAKSEDQYTHLEHYSDKKVDEIHPKFHGTGVSGNERKRKAHPDWVDRSYHYDAGSKPEADLGSKRYKHTSKVPSHKIYDLHKDPKGFRKNPVDKQGYKSINVVERRVKDAGYAGFRHSGGNMPNAVALFHPVRPHKVENRVKKSLDQFEETFSKYVFPGLSSKIGHGWISPKGEFHHIDDENGHGDFHTSEVTNGVRIDIKPDYMKGWVSVGHGGGANMRIHSSILKQPHHPAMKTAREMAGDATGEFIINNTKVHPGHFSKHGRIVTEDSSAFHRSESMMKRERYDKRNSYSIISGEQPRSKVTAKKPLEHSLKQAGYKYHPLKGKYGGKHEKSYAVYNADHKHIEQLGREHGQESVIHSKQGKHRMVYTTGKNAGQHHKGEGITFHKKPPKDNYSTSPDGKTHFTLNFDFGKLHSPKKKASNPEK